MRRRNGYNVSDVYGDRKFVFIYFFSTFTGLYGRACTTCTGDFSKVPIDGVLTERVRINIE